MIAVEIKINNVPTDRIDIINTTHICASEILCEYRITHYDYLAKCCGLAKCSHDQKDGRFVLIEKAMKALVKAANK